VVSLRDSELSSFINHERIQIEMMDATSLLNLLGGYLFVVFLPLLVLYVVYLILSRAFHEMGFSSWEAVVIVFVSFLLGSGLADGVAGIRFSNITLFTYHTYWLVGVNVGGALIPLALSVYLIMKNKLRVVLVLVGIVLVAVITYLVTYSDPTQGIVAEFPYWLIPVLGASLLSVVLAKGMERKAAPFAYTIGTLGVLIGADLLHLYGLLSFPVQTSTNAVIGGASVFDMVFITGVLAVFLDSLFLYRRKRSKKANEPA
jgi:uncharacterized membrane protein